MKGLLLALTPLGIGEFRLNGGRVNAHEFFNNGGLIIILFYVVTAGIGFSLWRERPWSRPLMLLSWVIYAVWDIGQFIKPAENGRSASFAWVVALPVAVWYLYGKRNVVSYYRSLSTHVTTEGS